MKKIMVIGGVLVAAAVLFTLYQLLSPINFFNYSSPVILDTSVLVTKIEYVDKNMCHYELSQTNLETKKAEKKFSIKAVCGMYQVPEGLILCKGYKTLYKETKPKGGK